MYFDNEEYISLLLQIFIVAISNFVFNQDILYHTVNLKEENTLNFSLRFFIPKVALFLQPCIFVNAGKDKQCYRLVDQLQFIKLAESLSRDFLHLYLFIQSKLQHGNKFCYSQVVRFKTITTIFEFPLSVCLDRYLIGS